MQNQDYRFLLPVVVQEPVAIDHGQHHHRYNEWLRAQIAVPRFCSRHPEVRLVPGGERRAAGIFEILRNAVEHDSDKTLFKASFYCPACRCAYALCPPEFLETSFETFEVSAKEQKIVLSVARDFVKQINQHGCGFAVFVGMPGTGKTRLGCNIIGGLDRVDGLYIRQGELLAALRATYGRKRYDDDDKRHTSETLLATIQCVGMLVLDEVGCVEPANDERIFLDELLKHRYEQRKPTLLISNLPLDQLKAYLGHALADRIYHASGRGKFIVQFDFESYRRSGGEEYLMGSGRCPARVF